MNKRLKAERERRKWTQARIAGYLEIGEQTYKDWEAGRRNPNGEHKASLCALLHKTPKELGLE
jgi:DNA-binding XRE family transcriptional regulator